MLRQEIYVRESTYRRIIHERRFAPGLFDDICAATCHRESYFCTFDRGTSTAGINHAIENNGKLFERDGNTMVTAKIIERTKPMLVHHVGCANFTITDTVWLKRMQTRHAYLYRTQIAQVRLY